MMNLAKLLVSIFILQNTVFYLGSHSLKKSLYEENTSKPISLEESLQLHDKEIQMKSELWNCVSLQLGANIGPSIRYRGEYWRIFACFFLHENVCHLLLNILMILYYDKCIQKKRDAKFYLFLVLSLLNANLTSNFFTPNFLKLGSSFLSSLLLTLSFLQNFNQRNTQFYVDLLLLGFLFYGTLN